MTRQPHDTDEDRDFASPPCGLHEAGDAYMGYLPRAELLPLLDELLGAARSLVEAAPEEITSDLRQEAAHWCATLVVHMICLRAVPAPVHCGGLSAAAARARIGSILRTLLPKVRSDDLHADLAEILRAHDARA